MQSGYRNHHPLLAVSRQNLHFLPAIFPFQPGAEVEEDGFKATHSQIGDVTAEDVGDWIADLNL